jgi:hypothetical protein
MSTPTPDLLLLEVEEIIRSMPSQRDFVANPQKCLPWLGRASAAMNAWDSIRSIAHFEPLVQQYSRASAQSGNLHFGPTHQSLLVLLHQAQSDLRLKTTGPLSVGVPSGRVFEYFDEVRKLIESAKADLLFVDPYIDAEFVSRYLPLVSDGTAVRILARERIQTLKPAVGAFVAQTGYSVVIRSATGFHDRYLFVDGLAGYQSGASFKDGAKKAPTTLTQITDAFSVVLATYEQLWAQATPV